MGPRVVCHCRGHGRTYSPFCSSTTVSGVTERYVIAFRGIFLLPDPPPPKNHCQSRNSKAKVREENRGILTLKLSGKTEVTRRRRRKWRYGKQLCVPYATAATSTSSYMLIRNSTQRARHAHGSLSCLWHSHRKQQWQDLIVLYKITPRIILALFAQRPC